MSKWLTRIIVQNAFYQRMANLAKRIKLGKKQVSLYYAIAIFFEKLWNDEILDRANGVAFSFALAVFPAIIFLFTLVPYIQYFVPDINNDQIIGFMANLLPENLYAVADTTIHDIINKERGGLLSFGFVFTLILSTNGMTSLMSAFNACYKTVETRSFLKMRMVATMLIFVLSLCVLLSIALLVVGQQLLQDNNIRQYLQEVISLDLILILRFVMLYLIFQIAISSIFYFAPAVHERWHFFSIGSIFSTIASLVATFGFSFYVNNFGTYNKLYGSIGVLLVFMLLLFIFSLILLVGFEMNAAIDQAKLKYFEEEPENF